jgi:hypothetical protein
MMDVGVDIITNNISKCGGGGCIRCWGESTIIVNVKDKIKCP